MAFATESRVEVFTAAVYCLLSVFGSKARCRPGRPIDLPPSPGYPPPSSHTHKEINIPKQKHKCHPIHTGQREALNRPGRVLHSFEFARSRRRLGEQQIVPELRLELR
jgi:hypothetical protein